MALRSRAEIEAKIAELRKSVSAETRKVQRIAVLLVFFFIFSVLFVNLSVGGFFMKIGSVLISLLLLLLWAGYYSRWKRTAQKRKLIANHLAAILTIYDKADAEDILTNELDKKIISRNEPKPFYSKLKYSYALKHYPQKEFDDADAALQAYTWVVSPGMDFRGKEE